MKSNTYKKFKQWQDKGLKTDDVLFLTSKDDVVITKSGVRVMKTIYELCEIERKSLFKE